MGIAGSTGLGDYAFSGKFRDIIEVLVEGAVNRLRPEDRIGKVFSINANARTAKILFPGGDETTLATVRFGPAMMPTVTMDSTYQFDGMEAAGDVVRVSGKPGDHYISDFIVGNPAPQGNITKIIWDGFWPPRPPNAIYVQWVGPTEPTEGMVNGDEFVLMV